VSEHEDRLIEFLEWAAETGITDERMPEYRRVATELFERANGRVREAHVLGLSDVYTARGDEAGAALAGEVGDALLSFQANKSSGVQSLPLSGTGKALPTNRPKRPRPPGDHTGSKPAIRQAPPAPVRVTAPVFPPPETEPDFYFPDVVPEPPVLPDISVNPSPATTLSPHAGVRFRCLKCLTFVTATGQGVCPQCGTRPPRAAPIVTTRTAPRSRLKLLLGVLVVIGFLVGGVRLVMVVVDRLSQPSESVAGAFRSEHLGAGIAFPAGWRRLRAGDAQKDVADLAGTPLADALVDAQRVPASSFFRGERAGAAGEHLTVARAPLREGTAAGWLAAASADPSLVAGAFTGTSARLGACEPSESPVPGARRCTGTSGRRAAVAYLWTETAHAGVLLLVSTMDAAQTDKLAETLADGIESDAVTAPAPP
jgi:hypothetical protein